MKTNKPINVFLSKYLTTDSDLFRLGALCEARIFDEVDKKWVWLEFKELKSKQYPKQELVWDNPNYLKEELYEYLKCYLANTVTKAQKEEFEDISDYMDKEKAEDLLELLEIAKDLNWF